MKSSIKRISAILFSLVMLTTLFAMIIPVSAENEGKGTYISALCGLTMTKEDEYDEWSMENVDFQKNVDMLSERGYSALWFDFNQEGYNSKSNLGQYKYYYRFAPFAIGYQTTTDKKDAITGIIVRYGKCSDLSFDLNGITYSFMGGWEYEDEIVKVDGIDLNRFIHGEYIYIYYTKDPKAGAPITALKGSNSAAESGYECARNMVSHNPADLNSGSDMVNECGVYLHIQRDASALGSVFGGGNTLIIVIAAVVVVIGAVLAVFLVKKKKA